MNGASFMMASHGAQMRRHGAVQQACRREAERYAGRRRETEGAISAAGADIKAAKGVLAEAQTLRANVEEYEVLLQRQCCTWPQGTRVVQVQNLYWAIP